MLLPFDGSMPRLSDDEPADAVKERRIARRKHDLSGCTNKTLGDPPSLESVRRVAFICSISFALIRDLREPSS
jgi:hypothetical protein